MKKLLPFLFLILPLQAQDKGRWVDPVTSTTHIAANPRAWQNKPTAIAASFHPPVKQPDGRWLASTGRGSHILAVVLTPEAHAYYLVRKKQHSPAVYHGEVMMNPADGTLRLHLYKGLTTAPHRPAVTASGASPPTQPPLKATP